MSGDMESFALSHEDAEDKGDWKLRISWQPANPGLPGKWLLWCICVSLILLPGVASS